MSKKKIDYRQEFLKSIRIAHGDKPLWKSCIGEVKKILNSWNNTKYIDFECEILEGIWSASKTYRPMKMKFASWAAFVINRRLINKLEAYKGRRLVWCQAGLPLGTYKRNHCPVLDESYNTVILSEDDLEETLC